MLSLKYSFPSISFLLFQKDPLGATFNLSETNMSCFSSDATPVDDPQRVLIRFLYNTSIEVNDVFVYYTNQTIKDNVMLTLEIEFKAVCLYV